MGQSKTTKASASKSASSRSKRAAARGEKKRDRPKTLKPSKPIEVFGHQQPPSMLVGRVSRVIRLMTLMQSKERLTVPILASRLGVSKRTVFRDLKILERAGVPFVNTPQGYVLNPNYHMVQLNLGVPEALGLMVLCKIAKALPRQPLFGAAIGAVTKCLMQLPEEQRLVYEDLVRNVTYSPGFVNISEEDERHFCQLQYAIDECIVCTLRYNPVGEHEPVHTDIEPVHLHFHKHSWYLLAYSEQHDEVRMFKLARISRLEVTGRTFEPFPFSIDEFLDGAWGLIPGTQIYDVVIEFTPKVARNVSEIRWHASQRSEMHSDGSCIMRFCVNGLDEMKWWLFSYADQAIVHEPAELREKIREMARRTLARNEEKD